MQTADRAVIRCERTHAPLYRKDPEGRGVWIWCRGDHREELKTWEELGLTRKMLERLLETMKA